MSVKPIFIIFFSLLTAIYSIIHIYQLAVPSSQYAEKIMMENAITDSTSLLIFNFSFWFWTILAWISAYLLIRSYLFLTSGIRQG